MADGSKKEKSGSKRGGISTLSDLNRRNAPDSDSDSDGPQEYYTGGEKSGMMVQDPQGGKKQVDSIFDRAKQHEAQEASIDARPSASSSATVAFTGTARTVSGATPQPQQQQQQQPGREPVQQAQPPEPVFHTITFWRNGFTVDDGPLRGLEDPANLPLLKSIRDGECPPELEPANRRNPVHVNLVRRDEDWQAPKEPKYKAFQGSGRTLGSSSSSQQQQQATTTTVAEPVRGVVVDEQQPFTSLQLRLADGTRMVARFNHGHTVGHIRDFINAARADGPKSYSLQAMGFPPKELTDLSQTIEAAGLLNAVVIQKLS